MLFSVDEVNTIRGLRTQYTRELKKVLGAIKSGAGTHQLLSSNWIFLPAGRVPPAPRHYSAIDNKRV